MFNVSAWANHISKQAPGENPASVLRDYIDKWNKICIVRNNTSSIGVPLLEATRFFRLSNEAGSLGLNSYVDSVAKFNGYFWRNVEIRPEDIKGRALNLGIPINSETAMQHSVIDVTRARAKSLGVDLIITPF